jgi:hypothetical protein
MKLVRSSVSIVCGLPRDKVGSAPAIVFSGPAQRSLALWPARSPSHLVTLSIESSDSFVASAAVSIATGWSEPVPGRELHPLKSSAFYGALYRQLRHPLGHRIVHALLHRSRAMRLRANLSPHHPKVSSRSIQTRGMSIISFQRRIRGVKQLGHDAVAV